MKALSFDDISLVPRFNNITSRRDVDTSVKFGNLDLKIPIFSSNMDTVTGSNMASTMYSLGGLGFLHRFCTIEQNVELYMNSVQCELTPFSLTPIKLEAGEAVVSLGVNEELDRFNALHEMGARYFCIDVAHGHSKAVGHIIKQIKESSDNVFVVAGNICTYAGAEYLAGCGADAIKVGIGPGSVCTTRIQTGFGVPQFSAIQDCRRVNCFIIADGGIRTPGDAVKAFAAGADAIMLGGMLAGCDETPGEVQKEYKNISEAACGLASGPSYKVFRGMASREAAEDHFGHQADWKTAEGVEIKVKAKGPIANVVSDIMGGIRSGMTYCGANNLKQIRERADYIEISAAGAAEGTPHGEGRL